MSKWWSFWASLVLLCLLTGAAWVSAQDAVPVRPAPTETLVASGIAAELYFSQLEQGTFGVIRLTGSIVEARAFFLNRQYPFFEIAGDGWYSFVVAAIDARPRDYPLSLLIRDTNGVDTTLDKVVTITDASFNNQNFNLSPDRVYLTEPEVERLEFARLNVLIKPVRPERLWDSWQMPMDAPLISGFGQYRIFNQNIQTRHTGVDQEAPVGTAVAVIARGEVVYAGRLDIRGNYVLIDHGYGIYSGYAHFSQINVERGQTVEKGQIIGLTGNTGRSSGPHLHWEVAINGEWVDGIRFLASWLPS